MLGCETRFNLSLCEAIELCRDTGALAARSTWKPHEKIAYQKGYPEGIKCNKQTADTWHIEEGEEFKCMPYLQKRSTDGMYSMWQPTLEELLSKDWYVIFPRVF